MESYNLDIINIVSVKTMEFNDENGTNVSRKNLTNEGSGTSYLCTFTRDNDFYISTFFGTLPLQDSTLKFPFCR